MTECYACLTQLSLHQQDGSLSLKKLCIVICDLFKFSHSRMTDEIGKTSKILTVSGTFIKAIKVILLKAENKIIIKLTIIKYFFKFLCH